MQTLKLDAVIDEAHTISLVLPANFRPGKAEVIVMVDANEPKADKPKTPFKRMSDEEFEKLMHFGDGRRLDGISLRELIMEGRR